MLRTHRSTLKRFLVSGGDDSGGRASRSDSSETAMGSMPHNLGSPGLFLLLLLLLLLMLVST